MYNKTKEIEIRHVQHISIKSWTKLKIFRLAIHLIIFVFTLTILNKFEIMKIHQQRKLCNAWFIDSWQLWLQEFNEISKSRKADKCHHDRKMDSTTQFLGLGCWSTNCAASYFVAQTPNVDCRYHWEAWISRQCWARTWTAAWPSRPPCSGRMSVLGRGGGRPRWEGRAGSWARLPSMASPAWQQVT